MKSKVSTFQYVLVAIFIILGVGGLIFFSVYKGSNKDALPQLTIWGTLPSEDFRMYTNEIDRTYGTRLDVVYVQKNASNIYGEFIEAIASGVTPDLLLVPADSINLFEGKIVHIPFETLSARTFSDTYLNAFEVLIAPDGIIGLPVTIDPLVMYWNKSLLTQGGIAQVPRTWEQVIASIPKLTRKTARGDVFQSTIALGDFQNVIHASNIFAALLLQAGDPITSRTLEGLRVVLGEASSGQSPAAAALSFYIQFSNPQSPAYTWNRSLLPSLTSFIGGTLSMYIGHASELSDIRAKNPQLDFDVSLLPQRNAGIPVTGARSLVFLIPSAGLHQLDSYTLASQLGSREAIVLYNTPRMLPSVFKADIVEVPNNKFLTVFNQSALYSKMWTPLNPNNTNIAFKTMIEQVISGNLSPDEALRYAQATLSGTVQ